MDQPTIPFAMGRLRPFRADDAVSIARHADDREVWANLRDRFPHPYTPDHARGWFAHIAATSGVDDFAIEVDGEAVGAIGCVRGEDVSRHSAEVGYRLGRDYWGRGVASAAIRAATVHFLARPEIFRLHATVFGCNLASARVLEKAGYRLEGRLRSAVVEDGRVMDGLLNAIVREDQPAGRSSSGTGFEAGGWSNGAGR